MPLGVPNDRVWLDGIMLYRDDVERMCDIFGDPDEVSPHRLTALYQHQRSPMQNALLKDLDLEVVSLLQIPFKVTVDVQNGRVFFNLPDQGPDRQKLNDFVQTLDRLPTPSRLTYLLRKPNPYSVHLSNLTRVAAKEEAKRRRRRRQTTLLTVAGLILTAAGIAATIAVA